MYEKSVHHPGPAVVHVLDYYYVTMMLDNNNSNHLHIRIILFQQVDSSTEFDHVQQNLQHKMNEKSDKQHLLELYSTMVRFGAPTTPASALTSTVLSLLSYRAGKCFNDTIDQCQRINSLLRRLDGVPNHLKVKRYHQ